MRYDHGGLPHASIDASVNTNPLGPPEALDCVFARAREIAMRYPEIDARRACIAWAERLDIPSDCVLIGNGASELISLAMRTLRPERVIVFEPCYSEYASAAKACGAKVVRLRLRRDDTVWSTPLYSLEPLPTDLLVVGQPNNPTGHLVSPDAIERIARLGAKVLLDESFLPFLAEADSLSMVSRKTPGIFVVTSLTKVFCVPGLRIGLFVGDASTVSRMLALRDPWSVNGLAAEAAEILAREEAYLARTRVWLAKERPNMARLLGDVPGVCVCDGVAPFILAALPEGVSAKRLRDALVVRGIGVRDASTFVGLGARWLRVGVRTAAENAQVVAAIANYCKVSVG